MGNYIHSNDTTFNSLSDTGLDSLPLYSRVRCGSTTYVLVKENAGSSLTLQQGIDQGYLKQEFNKCQSTYYTSNSRNYQIFPSGWFGKLKLTTYDSSNNVTGYFEIVNYNSEICFEVVTAHFSQSIRSRGTRSSTSLILFLGWCLYNNGYFGICVENNTDCHHIMIDTSECEASVQWSEKSYHNSSYIYAPRKGGGSFIQGIGIKFESMRTTTGSGQYESYDFYKFKNGFIEWNTSINVSSSAYPQYSSEFHRLNITPNGYFTRCIGGNASSSVGGTQSASAPNIKGRFKLWNPNWEAEQSFYNESYIGNWDRGNNATSAGNYWCGFNANKSSSTYVDGAELKPINLAVRWFVKVY